MDLLPTFAMMAGVSGPAKPGLDGKDISALMAGGPGAKSPHEVFYFHDGQGRLRALRSGKWKLHIELQPKLYDLSADIGESKNVAAEHPSVTKRLWQLAAFQ
jgi:arylsulfatase A-like enzyme